MSNIEILSAVHGIAPRSDELLRLGTDLERGRVSAATYDERLTAEQDEWIRLQNEAGIDIQEDGKFCWQDHFRPIVTASSGFAEGIDEAPVTRWFQTNTFYRQPTITGPLRLDPDKLKASIGPLGENVSLLTPSSFAALCRDEHTELPAARNVLNLYADLFFYFENNGVKRITLEDYHTSHDDLLGRRNALEEVRTLHDWYRGQFEVSALTPGRYNFGIPWTPIDNLAVEVAPSSLQHFKRQSAYARPDISHAEIWQQVIDTETTKVDVLDVDEYPIDALQELNPARVILTHSVDPEFLPLPYAQEKIKRLGEFAQSLQERVGEEL